MRYLIIFLLIIGNCLSIRADEIDRDSLALARKGWESYLLGTQKYKKCELTLRLSNQELQVTISSDGRKCLLEQENPDGSPSSVIARNDGYSFYLEPGQNNEGYSIKTMRTDETAESPNGAFATAVEYAQFFESGFVLLPATIGYSKVDWLDPEWGLSSFEKDSKGLWTLRFNANKEVVQEDGISYLFGLIDSGEIVLDPNKSWLPVHGNFKMKVSPDGAQTYTEKVQWNYEKDIDGDFLPTSMLFWRYGDDMPDLEPDSEMWYRQEWLGMKFATDLRKDEFSISRFGFDEPVVKSRGIDLTYFLIGGGVFFLLLGSILLRKLGKK